MLDFQRLFAVIPGLYIIYDLDFVIVGGSDAYFQATKTKREEVVGRHLFEVFPDNPDDLNADGVRNLRASIESVLKHQKQHMMAVQKYDIRRPASEGGGFEECYWTSVNSPFFNEHGEMTHIIHRAEDVTEFVRVRQQRNEQRQLNQALQSRNQQMEMEIYARAQELRARDSLESILTRIADQFLALDREWRYTYVNEQVTKVTRIARKNLLGRSIWEVFPDMVGSEFYTQVYDAVAKQTPIQFAYFYPTWNRWFENHVYPCANGVSIIVTEISDRKCAEQAIAADLRDTLLLHELSTRLICEGDIQVLLDEILAAAIAMTQANAGTIQLLDAQRNELVLLATQNFGREMTEHFARVDASYSTPCGIALATEAQTFIDFDAPGISDPDGSLQMHVDAGLLSAQSIPLIARSGKAMGMLSTHWRNHKRPTERELRFVDLLARQAADLIERQQTSAALRESEALFRSFAENTNDTIWITAAQEYRLIYVSPSYEQVWGRSATEIYTDLSRLIEFVHTDDRDRIQTGWQQCAEGGFSQEYRVIRPDKSIIWIHDRGFLIYDNQGELLYLGSITEDITDRKHAEAQRDALLNQAQAAREAADRANRIKDEFLAVLSHELRSPLNPILGWSKMLQQKKLDEAITTNALTTIERNAQLQVQLIDDLLDMSRILRGKLSLTMIPVDLGKVISAAQETVRLTAEAKAIQIQTTVLPGIGMVMGDAGRLQQVVWNLLSNAVKFTPRGGQVTIALASHENHAQIQVTDTGKGIKSDFLPYVFEHFRQEDGATTRKFGGLGLGLAIARQIVEMHGGTVAVDSSGEGEGATFTVRILLASRYTVLPAIEPPKDSTGNLSGIRILVVDDDADSREFVAFVLEQAGAIVTSVTSGIEALQAFSQAVPDLIVSDIGMPSNWLLRQNKSSFS